MSTFNVYTDFMAYFPPDVLELILEDEEPAAAKLLKQELLRLPGIGPARAKALLGQAEDASSLTLWATYAMAVLMQNPENFMLTQERQIKAMGAQRLQQWRQHERVGVVVPAKWDRKTLQILRTWISDYAPRSRVILEDHLDRRMS